MTRCGHHRGRSPCPSDSRTVFARWWRRSWLRSRSLSPAAAAAPASAADLAVVVCTRDRPNTLEPVLESLVQQAHAISQIIVVDQGSSWPAAPPVSGQALITVVRDRSRGLSRARNRAMRETTATWVAFLDDDCLPDPDWAATLKQACAEHPNVDYVSGAIRVVNNLATNARALGASSVTRPRLLSGRWRSPQALGYGATFAVRRSTVDELGGWDERLGAGTSPFPAGEDLDFNYRFLRAGGVAFRSPEPKVTHLVWRTPEELVAVHCAYLKGKAGYAVKHLRTGDPIGGTRLWLQAAGGVGLMFGGAACRCSGLHWRLTLAQARGLGRGTAAGLRHDW